MRSTDPETHKEIIIVRRGGNNDDEEHHGGVWKIAYADFMTAMMAFFLVMWLISAANEETKAAVASYFNPLKLVDTRGKARGIENINAQTRSGDGALGDPPHETGNSAVEEKNTEQAEENGLMAFPYQTLDEIADDSSLVPEGRGGASAGGMQFGSASGTAYRDPFSPDYWDKTLLPDIAPAGADTNRPVNGHDTMMSQTEISQSTPSKTEAKAEQKEKVDAAPAVKPEAAKAEAAGSKAGRAEEAAALPPEQVEKAPQTVLAGKIRSDISKLLQKETVTGAAEPRVQVTAGDNGVTIELTDSQNYGMFAVGSAKPDKKLISVLEGVAKILQDQKGEVIISGHTDARPYRSTHYDNWQLSSARAQMAYYMLVRGGLDESRVLRVEGYADRDLKNSKDPHAAENRRISVFLKLPQTEEAH